MLLGTRCLSLGALALARWRQGLLLDIRYGNIFVAQRGEMVGRFLVSRAELEAIRRVSTVRVASDLQRTTGGKV